MQKIMGLSSTAYKIAWIATYYLFGFILMTILYIVLVAMFKLSAGILFVVSIFYNIATFNQTYFLSIFFRNPKLAGEITNFIKTLSSGLFFLLFVKDIADI